MNIQNLNILVLEDDPSRIKKFKELVFTGNTLTVTDKSKECIEYLKKNKYDLLFLDHDLGGQQMVKSGENTGYEVAKFLEANPQFIPDTVIIHSLNGVGAANIKAAIPKAIQIPFAWMQLNT